MKGSWRCLGWIFLTALAAGQAREEGQALPVKLPPFVVTEVREGLKWFYGMADGCEVLALCDDALTRQFVQAQGRGTWFFPRPLREVRSEPVRVLLWGGKDAPLPPAKRIGYYASGYNFGWKARGWFVPNVIAGANAGTAYISANLALIDRYEAAAIHLARLLLGEAAPAYPAWVREGMVGDWGLFPGDLGVQQVANQGLDTEPLTSIRLPRLPWPGEMPESRQVSLEELLATWNRESVEAPLAARRCAEAGLFARWALFGPEMGAERTGAFWSLAEWARSRPVTEEVFRSFFRLGFAEAEKMIEEFAVQARWESPRVRVQSSGSSEAAELRMRLATEAEVARLKGGFERLEMRRWRESNPSLAAGYEAAVRRTIRRGLKHAPEDPQVHELAGLVDYDTGRFREAQPFLEFAYARTAAGTEALLALARLRLADLRSGLSSGAKLSAEAVERVLTPLYEAKERKPAVADVYRAIAEVWAQSAEPPRRGHLAVLIEGCWLFPQDAGLLWQTAELHRAQGFIAEAEDVAAFGLRHAATPDWRQRFESLVSGPSETRGEASPK